MKYCKNCGKQCEDGENFCRVCGNAVGGSLAENEGVSGDIHDASAVQKTYDDFAVRQGNSEPPVVENNVAAAGLGDCGTQHTGNGASDNNQSFNRPNNQPYDQPCDCPGDRPVAGGQSYDPRNYSEQTLGDQNFGGHPFVRQYVSGQSYDGQPTNEQPMNSQPYGGRPIYDRPFDRPQYGNPQQNNMPPYGSAPQYNGSVPPYYSNGNVPPYCRQNGYYGRPYAVPQNPNKGNATASLVLGILSIVFSATGIGFILSIIGLVLGVKSMKGYQNGEPGRGVAVAGFVCSIIGLVFSLYAIFVFLGAAVLSSSASYYR